MKNFGRVVRLALRHWTTIIGIVISSVIGAFFWGANISAVYPFIEVVFQGDSMHGWVEVRIKDAERRAAELRSEIQALQPKRTAADSRQRSEIDRSIKLKEKTYRVEQKAIGWYRWAEPLIKRHLPDDAFQTLLLVVGFVATSTLIRTIFLGMNMVLVERLAERTKMKLRDAFYGHSLNLEVAAFSENGTSDLMSRFTGDVNLIGNGIMTLFGKSLQEPLKMLACFAVAATISWRLLVFSMIIAPMPIFLMYKLAHAIKRSSKRVAEEMALFYQRLSETFSGIMVVKAFTMEEEERLRFGRSTQQLLQKSMRIAVYTALTRMNTELLGVGVICLATLAGGYLVLFNETDLLGIKLAERSPSFGALILFFGCLAGISDPARKLANVIAKIQRASASADRVYDKLDRKSNILNPTVPTRLPVGPGPLSFEHIQFHYNAETPVLDDIHLHIEATETIAIVGPNGCGKSTLLHLIPRFYDPVQGIVRLHGIDLHELAMQDLRSRIGIVSQRALLFEDTVYNNIAYGSPDATQEQVIEAARQAHAHSFIERELERGYDTDVGERGNRLSGGQQQRVALARAILRDPEILLLDEATSQIDPKSEQLIHQALEQFIRGRLALLVTHRMSTLALADRILVMESGRIVDVAPHDDLIERCELYARLHRQGLKKSA